MLTITPYRMIVENLVCVVLYRSISLCRGLRGSGCGAGSDAVRLIGCMREGRAAGVCGWMGCCMHAWEAVGFGLD